MKRQFSQRRWKRDCFSQWMHVIRLMNKHWCRFLFSRCWMSDAFKLTRHFVWRKIDVLCLGASQFLISNFNRSTLYFHWNICAHSGSVWLRQEKVLFLTSSTLNRNQNCMRDYDISRVNTHVLKNVNKVYLHRNI